MKRTTFFSDMCAATLSAALLVPPPLTGVIYTASPRGSILATLVNLAVVNVLAQDTNTGKPLEGLQARDFEVFDNGEPARISVFRHADQNIDPISLWLVAKCSQKSGEENSPSSFVAELLEPALKQLNPGDKIGVAHWCPYQNESGIDLAATEDRHVATAALNAALHRSSHASHDFNGTGNLQEILSLIHRQPSGSDIETNQIVVFLGAEGAGLPKEDTAHLAREVASHTSLTVYVITRSAAGFMPRLSSMAYLCKETGGEVVFTNGANWGDAVGRIVDGVHSRYLIAYLPPKYDLNWHAVSIRLTGEAIRKNGSVLLGYRSGYSGSGNPPLYVTTEQPRGPDLSLDSSLSEAVAGAAGSSDIPFEVEGATYEGPSSSAKLTLKMGDDRALSWTPLPNGSHCSEITVVIAFLSPQGETIGRRIKTNEIVRRPTDSWTLLNQRIVIDNFVEYPAGADRIRFVIRDDTTGRIGSQDVPMRKILNAPKLRAVIY